MRTSILFLASGIFTCFIPARVLGQGPEMSKSLSVLYDDSSAANRGHGNRFVYRLPTIRSKNAIALDYIRFADRFLAIKNREQATGLVVRGFEDVRRSGDIVAENIFVSKMTYLIPGDTTLIPLAVSLMDQLVIDNDRLLPRMTDKELQRGTVNQFAETGCTYVYARRTDIAIRYELMAIRLNERLHQHASFPYQNLSFLYTTRGRLKDALTLALDAMRISETPAGVVDAAGYESLARVYFMTGDFDKCAEFSEKAFALYVKDPSTVEYAGVLIFRYVQVLLQQQRAAEALRFLRSLPDPSLSSRLDDGDQANWALSRAECFRALGQRDSAERWYAKAIDLKPPISASGSWFRISTGVCLATFYSETGRYVQAGRLLDTLLGNNFRGIVSAVFLEKTLLLRYRVDSALHNFPRAMMAIRQYQQLHDSQSNYRLNKQLADMSVRSETEKAAQHITDLEKQSALQTRLQQSALRQDRLVRNCLIAGTAVFAFFVVLLYSRWRTRRRMSLQLQKANLLQQKLLGEKEWLLREIHHRVKNNLQVIISLMNMQAGELKDEIAISAFEDIGARVNTISLVHKKLYQEDMASIDMRDYIRELVGFLKEGVAVRKSIAFDLDVQHLILDPTQCLPLGLILNEAVTNAIKYAFRGDLTGSPTIHITLQEEPEDWITLVVADNGVGLPADFDPGQSRSLGLQLIRTLTEQLDGTLEMVNRPGLSAAAGLTLRVRFPWIEPMSAAL
ncbi:MAG TPA: histidine kinase dimerization/phosphoacceptor domain -containing protein [Puia sp.]